VTIAPIPAATTAWRAGDSEHHDPHTTEAPAGISTKTCAAGRVVPRRPRVDCGRPFGPIVVPHGSGARRRRERHLCCMIVFVLSCFGAERTAAKYRTVPVGIRSLTT